MEKSPTNIQVDVFQLSVYVLQIEVFFFLDHHLYAGVVAKFQVQFLRCFFEYLSLV